ncbi:MAG: lysophospholipid acyltransferase family protein [Proteobacteria bacterium]|nr:lysophospholipid acyltransferase family protein [Pseudomonadota bacterium]MDA1070803.1 lysophospholipid acyltransferase family protein [Pseudomonadota bacterium]
MIVTLAVVRLVLYVALTLPCMPIQAVLVAIGARASVGFAQGYHRLVCRIFGIRLDVRGRIARDKPLLIVANHTSYLDIEILGALVRGSFVAKAEVARWPLFGWLAKLQRTVFVDRRPSQAGKQKDAITRRLEGHGRLILFPEGTTSDGNRVLPFKRALFAVAQQEIEGKPLTVQPVSVAYAGFSNLPMDRDMRPTFAWYGDMDLLPHAWRFLGAGTLTVIVQFHPALTIADAGGDRRRLAAMCEETVAQGVADALAGALPAKTRRRFASLRKLAGKKSGDKPA